MIIEWFNQLQASTQVLIIIYSVCHLYILCILSIAVIWGYRDEKELEAKARKDFRDTFNEFMEQYETQ